MNTNLLFFELANFIKENVNGFDDYHYNEIDRPKEKKYDYSLYSGHSGIALLLMEVYSVTGTVCFLEKAHDLLLDCLVNIEDNSDYSLYTGISGVCISLLRMGEITDNKDYIKRAISILKKTSNFLPSNNSDFLSGKSGVIITLLLAYKVSGDEEILSLLKRFLNNIVESSYYLDWGFCINSNYIYRGPLCGLSHGSSGVAFVFIEAYKLFGDKRLLDIAYLFFSYEEKHFSFATKNWVDLRVSPSSLPKNKITYINAWCHGAVGMLLPRINLYRVTGDIKLKKRIFDSAKGLLDKPYSFNIHTDFTLCHGLCSEILVLKELQFFPELQNQAAHKISVIKDAIHQNWRQNRFFRSGFPNQKENQDLSLFMGLSGIAYTLLISENNKLFNIVNPQINFTSYLQREALDLPSILEIKLSKIFPYLYIYWIRRKKLIKKIEKELIKRSIPLERKDLLIRLVRDIAKQNKSPNLYYVAKIEGILFNKRNNIRDWTEVAKKKEMRSCKDNSELIIGDEYIALKTHWDLSQPELGKFSTSATYFLAEITPTEFIFTPISFFTFYILSLYRKRRRREEVYKKIINDFFENEIVDIREKVDAQISILLNSNILRNP